MLLFPNTYTAVESLLIISAQENKEHRTCLQQADMGEVGVSSIWH